LQREKQHAVYTQGANFQERIFAFGYEVFTHTEKHRQLFRPLSPDATAAVIKRAWHKILFDLVREDVKTAFPKVVTIAARSPE
jgi:hypothetical protein